jgi:hypothetical protein
MFDPVRLAADLEALLDGNLDAAAVRGKYEPLASLDESGGIWSNLEHYLADGDIRARDERYRAMQDDEMRKLIGLLRSGAGRGQLEAIHFLGRT